MTGEGMAERSKNQAPTRMRTNLLHRLTPPPTMRAGLIHSFDTTETVIDAARSKTTNTDAAIATAPTVAWTLTVRDCAARPASSGPVQPNPASMYPNPYTRSRWVWFSRFDVSKVRAALPATESNTPNLALIRFACRRPRTNRNNPRAALKILPLRVSNPMRPASPSPTNARTTPRRARNVTAPKPTLRAEIRTAFREPVSY